MLRLSYARVLIEMDVLADLPHSINILPTGATLVQPVEYETLLKFLQALLSSWAYYCRLF